MQGIFDIVCVLNGFEIVFVHNMLNKYFYFVAFPLANLIPV